MLRTAFSIALLTIFVGCSAEVSTESPNAEASSVKETPVAFNLEGAPTIAISTPDMHCKNCAAGICKVLKEQSGVVDVQADVEGKVVTVAVKESEFDSEKTLEALTEANFRYSEILAEESDDEPSEG